MAEFLAAGTVLSSGRNNYVVQSVLGSGGFGITYKATVSTTFNGMPAVVTVAVKEHFLKNDCERDSTTMSVNCSQPARERVERSRRDFAGEARRLMSVAPGQPNIVQVSEVFDANNTSYYVMEYLDGMTLQDYVRQRGVITEQEMRGIMLPIVRAVGHLHRNRITHLDIKPTNIMLTKGADGRIRPVLIDFGLSKHYNADGAATSTINIQGFSDGYAPVEQYGGITSFSPASDVYSLAATMMFCLLGRALPKSMTLMSEDVRRLIPCNVSPQLQSVLTASLYMESRRRPADADAMLRMLTSAGAVTPTAPSAVHTTPYRPAQPTYTIGSTQTSRHTHMSRPATTVRRPQPAAPSGRSRSVVRGLLVAAIVLVLAGFGIWYYAFVNDKTPDVDTGVMKNYYGTYYMTGYVSNDEGDYQIAMNITIDSDGKVQGRYNYDLTVKKYGDVPSSYFYLDGNVVDNEGNIVMTSRLYGKDEAFETIKLRLSDDKKYLDGTLENCNSHGRYTVALSAAK